MIKYIKINKNTILDRENNWTIPCDIDNIDYQNYLAWVEEGNVADESETYKITDGI